MQHGALIAGVLHQAGQRLNGLIRTRRDGTRIAPVDAILLALRPIDTKCTLIAVNALPGVTRKARNPVNDGIRARNVVLHELQRNRIDAAWARSTETGGAQR